MPAQAQITFNDILENPSDLELNLKYAKEQQALGNLKNTIGTLERLNMLYPVNTDIKIYLLSILLKIDSISRLQLAVDTMLQDENTSKEARDYIAKIIKIIKEQSAKEKAKPKNKNFAYLDINYMTTDNSNLDGMSKTGTMFLHDPGEDINKITDFAENTTQFEQTYSKGVSLTVGRNLNPTSAISLNLGLTQNTQDKETTTTTANDVGSATVTYTKVLGKHFILPYVYYSGPNYRSTTEGKVNDDLNTYGVGFANTYNINKDNSISYGVSYSDTNYDKVLRNEAENPDFKNSENYGMNIGYNYSLSDTSLIKAKVSYTDKNAHKNYNGYEGVGYDVSFTKLLPIGNFVVSKKFQENNHDEKNTFYHTTINRVDDIRITKFQLTGKVNQLIPFFKRFDKKELFFFNVNHVKQDVDSSLLNYSAIRKTTSFNIIKRFSLYE